MFNDFHIELNNAYTIIDSALKSTKKSAVNSLQYNAKNRTEENRYVVKLEQGHEAFLRYRKVGNVLYLDHAEIPQALRGQAYGGVLMEAVLEKIQAESFKVIPVCAYVKIYFKRHKHWAHLLQS